MLDIEKDVEVGLDFSRHNYFNYINDKDNYYNRMYTLTNEELNLYFPKFKIEDSKVLTVASSGDHILESILYGANEIHAFDKNPFAIYMCKLKLAAVKGLNAKEYKKYFGVSGEKDILNIEYYRKFREYLDFNDLWFWDEMYAEAKLENHIDYFFVVYKYMNEDFLDQDKYESIKKRIEKVPLYFYHTDLFDIDNCLSNDIKFDSMFLSNIYCWINNNDKPMFVKYIKDKLQDYLSDQGQIAVLVSYLDNAIRKESIKRLEDVTSDILDVGGLQKVIRYRKNNIY